MPWADVPAWQFYPIAIPCVFLVLYGLAAVKGRWR